MTPNFKTPSVADVQFKQVRAIYLIFALSAIMCFISEGWVFALAALALFVGMIMMHSLRPKVKDSYLFTHVRWQIRTFWIGNLLVFPLAMIINIIWIYSATDIGAFMQNAATGAYGMDMDHLQADYYDFTHKNALTLFMAKLGTYGIALIWWLYRCVHGYRLLKIKKAVPKMALQTAA